MNTRQHLRELITAAGAIVATLPKPAARKSIDGYARSYVNSLSAIVADAINGEATAGDVGRVLRALIRSEAEGVFIEGLLESGEYANEAEARADMDDDDDRTIANWKQEQLGYVSAFAKDAANIWKARDDDAEYSRLQDDIFRRVDLWGASLAALGAAGRASVDKNKMVTWQYGDTEHCDTCLHLNGKRARLKWFTSRNYYPAKPAADMDCGGWNCQCKLIGDDGKQVLP